MIKDKNLRMRLLVFFMTVIVLVVFAKLYPEDNLSIIENNPVTTAIPTR